MKNHLKFLLEVEKLKQLPRTGWVLREVKNPETISEHTFRLTIISWFLAKKRKFNIERAIKIALSHDLCEVYAGDITPFFYYPRLPKDKKERKKILMKWARLSRKEKQKIGQKKFQKEKKAILKLVQFLKPNLRKEILSQWLEYGKNTSKEGMFIEQLNRIETLIQSIQYFGTKEVKSGTNWWEWVEEIVDDPLLLHFLQIIQKKLYKQIPKGYKKDKELESILDFTFEVGKLKQLPRTIWTSMGVKNPETVASHIFSVALMAWVLGKEKKNLHLKKLLKMALCHELPSVYTGDLITPYHYGEKSKREIFQKWPRLSKKEKEKKFSKDYQKEKKALEKLITKLETSLKNEIIGLWEEYKTASTPEARFLNQINVCAVLLQALQYKKREKDLPIDWLWEWAFEKCEDDNVLSFLEALKSKFYKTFLFPEKLLILLRLKK